MNCRSLTSYASWCSTSTYLQFLFASITHRKSFLFHLCHATHFSLLDGVRHEPLLGAIRAQDVLVVRDEALADHGDLAGGAGEAVVVPVPALERDEAGAADAWIEGKACTE